MGGIQYVKVYIMNTLFVLAYFKCLWLPFHPFRLWDLQAGQLLQTMVGHSDRVAAVALTADGEKALSASSDGSINVWSTDVHSR